METQKINSFHIIGISIRTTNENEQAAQDIPALWNRFMSENISEKIPNKLSNEIFCIYTEYEKDHTRPYTTLLGCKVENLDTLPEGMEGRTFGGGNYFKYTAKGNIHESIVYDEWLKIWNMDLNRSFTADFEIYGEKAQDPENAEVDIFIAINPS